MAPSMRSVVIDASDYDWEGNKPLNRPLADTVIYEAHVRGFTQSPTSNVLCASGRATSHCWSSSS